MENKTLYCIYQDYGSWDDYSKNLMGVFTSEEKAEEVKKVLEATLAEYHESYPRPKEDDYFHLMDEDNKGWDAYNEAEQIWWKSIMENEVEHLMRVNCYIITPIILDELDVFSWGHFLNLKND